MLSSLFLEQVLLKLGFSMRWKDMVMRCVSLVRFPVKLNGGKSVVFMPTRGLQQGDPISLYLFLLCVDGFSSFFLKTQEDRFSIWDSWPTYHSSLVRG